MVDSATEWSVALSAKGLNKASNVSVVKVSRVAADAAEESEHVDPLSSSSEQTDQHIEEFSAPNIVTELVTSSVSRVSSSIETSSKNSQAELSALHFGDRLRLGM